MALFAWPYSPRVSFQMSRRLATSNIIMVYVYLKNASIFVIEAI